MLEHEIEYEKQQFKQMTFEKKMEHIWTYYKVELCVASFLLIFLGWALVHFVIAPPAEVDFNITVYGRIIDDDAMDALETDCAVNFPHFYKEDTVVQVLGLQNYEGEAGSDQAQNNETVFMKMVGMAANKEIDVMILDLSAVKNFDPDKYFIPLDTIFTEDEMAMLLKSAEKRVQNNVRENEKGVVAAIYDSIVDGEAAESQPYLLCAGGNKKAEAVFNGTATPYLGIMLTSTNVEEAKEFIMYLMSE